MFTLSPETTIGDLVQSGLYGDFAKYFFTYMTPDHWRNPLSAYGYETVGFEPALRRMRELAGLGQPLHFPVYPEEERLLQEEAYQRAIAEAIARGVLAYLEASAGGEPLPEVGS